MESRSFQAQVLSIMEVLAQAAVAEINRRVDDSCAVLRLEVSQSRRDIDHLKRKCELMEAELRRSRLQVKRKGFHSPTVPLRRSVGETQHWSWTPLNQTVYPRSPEQASASVDPDEEVEVKEGAEEEWKEPHTDVATSSLESSSFSYKNLQVNHRSEVLPSEEQQNRREDDVEEVKEEAPEETEPQSFSHQVPPTPPSQMTQTCTSEPSAPPQPQFSDCPAGETRLFTCRFCGKSFARIHQFKEHQRCHTGERPYGCQQCGRRFTRHFNLVRHAVVHSGEKPFQCSLCGRSFTQRSSLKSHDKVTHQRR